MPYTQEFESTMDFYPHGQAGELMQSNPYGATTEAFVFDGSLMSDLPLSQLLADLEASSSMSPTSTSTSFDQSFDGTTPSYDWTMSSFTPSEAGQSQQQESNHSRRESSQDFDSEESKKSKRREQNRRAQRAFRERQETRIRQLQTAYDALLAKHENLLTSYDLQSAEKQQLLAMLRV